MSTTEPVAAPANGRQPFKRRGHILVALLGVLVLVGLVPLATVAWKLIDVNREALTTSTQQYQLLLATSTAREVDLHVEGLRSQLQRIAQTLRPAVRRDGSAPVREIRQVLEQVADPRMRYLQFARFGAQTVESISAETIPAEFEPLFREALARTAEIQTRQGSEARGQAVVFDPVFLDSDAPGAALVIAAPVLSRGSFRGVLTGLVDLQGLWEGLSHSSHRGHLIFAVDPDGRVIASGDPERLPPRRVISDNPMVRRFLSAGDLGTQTAPFTVIDPRNDEPVDYIGSFERSSQGWGIFVQVPQSEVYTPVRQMVRRTVTWILGALGLAGLAALFFARSLSNPINRLVGASRAFARGDFSSRVEVRSGNEIGELAHTFNTMAAEIESYIRRLRKALAENNELFLGTIRALAQAIDAKDPYTRGHSVRVNRYSVILAKQLDLSDAELREIHVASLLHDVGKIAIDDVILQKPGALTDEEFEVMKTHTVRGAEIMQPIRQMQNVLPGLRWHHERINGRGYPDGLSGPEIPMMARIIAVADTFDAITTARPYQQPMTFERAVARVNELKGDALDERVVEAFNRACFAGLIRPGSAEEDAREISAPAVPA